MDYTIEQLEALETPPPLKKCMLNFVISIILCIFASINPKYLNYE